MSYSYPTYQEKPAITSEVYQSGETIDWQNNYMVVDRSYVGPDTLILQMAEANRRGSGYDLGNSLSGEVEQCNTTKLDSDRTKLDLKIKCAIGTGDANVLQDTWTVQIAQMEVPLYRYCKPNFTSADVNNWGEAPAINAWENETDVNLKSAYKYRQYNPELKEYSTLDLSGRSLSIAMIINGGTESRMTFYPQASRTTICKDYTQLSNYEYRKNHLNYADNTPANFVDTISCMWLKTAFDLQQNTDNTWTVTESWIGSPYDLGGWQEPLYGFANHWKMWNGGN